MKFRVGGPGFVGIFPIKQLPATGMMTRFRLAPFSRREFDKELYRPGVISLTRLVWGSLGAGLLMFVIAVLSQRTDIGVLYPPLAATCFINATCVYLRVARPKSVIVGHFVSTIGGLLGVALAVRLFAGSELLVPAKLGFAVLAAAVFMQITDSDHPPAAATAAIPAILPLPAPALLLPLHMAWGAVIAVIFATAWNRVWFECPAPDGETCGSWFGLHMEKPDIVGTLVCIFAFVLMCAKPWLPWLYQAGMAVMLLGLLVLSFHHLFTPLMVRGREPSSGRRSGTPLTKEEP